MNKYKPRGIINNSGTHCWRNSLLQVIFNCPILIKQFLYRPVTELGEQIRNSYKNEYSVPYNQITVFNEIRNQQCVVEYFEYIIDNSFVIDKFPKEMINKFTHRYYDVCLSKDKYITESIYHWSGKDNLNNSIIFSLEDNYCLEHKTTEVMHKNLYKLHSMLVVSNLNKSTDIPDILTFNNYPFVLTSAILYSGSGSSGHYISWLNGKYCNESIEENYIIDDVYIKKTDKNYLGFNPFFPVLLFYVIQR